MKKIRMVIETLILDEEDATEEAERFALLGSEDTRVLTVIVALEGADTEDARMAAAGDSLVATLSQHFPGVFEEPEVNAEAAILMADVLGGILSLQLAVETEVEAAETVDIVVERLMKSTTTGAEKLRAVMKKDMN